MTIADLKKKPKLNFQTKREPDFHRAFSVQEASLSIASVEQTFQVHGQTNRRRQRDKNKNKVKKTKVK